jgi:hypothetical protein
MLINKELKIFVYNDKTSNINLFNLSNKVNIVYSINNSGTGFISYNPNSSFNSLNSLETNKTYLIAAKSEALPTIIQAVTTSTTPQPGVPTTPFPEGCFVGWPPVDICTADGHDLKYNIPLIADTFFNGGSSEDSCYCQCSTDSIFSECEKLGYNSAFIDLVFVTSKYGTETVISAPCSAPASCRCIDGYEYKESEQKCIEKNPKGVCCLDGSCNDDFYKEDCYGGVFSIYDTCGILEAYKNGAGYSSTAEECFACEKRLGFTSYTCPNNKECIYCNTGDFFDPQSCECYENCSDIIQNLPPCETGPRNPNSCECCSPISIDTAYGAINMKSFGYSQCLGRCAVCQGFDTSWNEDKCSCECVQDEVIKCPLASVKNPETCACECPYGIKESCENRGYKYIEPRLSAGGTFRGCGCDCSSEQGKIAQQKCPAETVPVPGQSPKPRWNSATCECDCSDKPQCTSPKVRNSLTCSCECPLAIEQGVPWFLVKCPNSNEDLNSETCQCEPKKYGAWCSGQLCPPKGQSGSRFYITGCEEGTFTSWRLQNANDTAQSFQEGKVCKEISCDIESLPPQCTTTTTTTTTVAPTTTTTVAPTTTTTTTTTTPAPNWYLQKCQYKNILCEEVWTCDQGPLEGGFATEQECLDANPDAEACPDPSCESDEDCSNGEICIDGSCCAPSTTTTPAPTTTTTTIGPTTTVSPTTTGGPSENKWYCIDC